MRNGLVNKKKLTAATDVHALGSPTMDKSAQIDLLLARGAKLSAATWHAARNKVDVQLKLVRKLCQDGFYLYKVSLCLVKASDKCHNKTTHAP